MGAGARADQHGPGPDAEHASRSGDARRAEGETASGERAGLDARDAGLPTGPRAEQQPVGGATLLRLQRSAGNEAVVRLMRGRRPTVQRDMAGTLEARAQQQIEAAKAARAAEQGGDEGDRAAAPSREEIAAEKAKQRRAVSGAVAPPDTSGARSQTASAATAAKAEAAKPPTPVADAKSTGGPSAGDAGGPGAQAGEATAAAQGAATAAATAAAVVPPEPPAPVEAPAAITTVDAGGRQLPADPAVEAAVAGVAGKLQALRAGAHEVRAAAAQERAQSHQSEGLLQAGRSGVADAEAGVVALRGHSAHRRSVVEQAKAALEVSQQKADTVASGAPEVAAKSEEGAQKSGPMASESKGLASENASKQPEDAEAAGQSAEQGSQLTRVGTDMGSIDSTIGQTKARAGQLAAEAAQAKASNTATQGKVAATEAAIAQTDAKAEELAGQNAAAKARLDGMAAQPAAHRAQAADLDSQGESLHAVSAQLEARLAASQQAYVAGMASTPPPVPARRGAAVQRAGYEGRTTLDPARAVNETLPSWLTGEDPPHAVDAQKHKLEEDARRAAEIAEIEKEAGGHFETLSASQKAGIALRLTGRNLFKEIGSTDLPKFGLSILRGFVDPRMSLMGVVHGVGSIATGVANLFSAEQWAKDPLGNALKSSADIATGVTIVLGSIAGLAVSIGIILTAVAIIGSIFSFGAVGVALAPIIAFCGTVASTVGPWALWAAAIALTLHGLVFIKNLIDAATAGTATELQQNSDQMTEDAKNAGAMALQIGMAKAMELGGKLLAGRGGGAPGEPAPGAGAGSGSEPVPAGGAGAPEPVPAGGAGAPEPVPAGGGGAPEPVPAGGGGAPEPVPAGGGGAPEPVPAGGGGAPEPVPAGGPEPAPGAGGPEPAPTAAPEPTPAGGAPEPAPELGPVDLPEGPVANDNGLPQGTAANDNALPGTEPQQQVLAGTGTDGPVDVGPARPPLEVLPGSAAEGAPRATAGEGPLGGGHGPEPVVPGGAGPEPVPAGGGGGPEPAPAGGAGGPEPAPVNEPAAAVPESAPPESVPGERGASPEAEPPSTGEQVKAEFDEFQERAEGGGDVQADLLESGLSERPEFQRPTGEGEVVTPESPVAKADATLEALLEHVDQAQERFNAEGFTESQTAAIERAPTPAAKASARARFYGERIDSFVKETIQGDRRLDHLGVSEIKQPGPDFFDPSIDTWYDITTARSWDAHVAKYGSGGTGVHVPSGR
ncbi:hypothetical protein [Cellulomonas sp.]|uniref:hypothetical protein n=1 Tax=Cellulomonas sp. TaxID=40001 RepID=UPI003BA8AC2F